MYEYKGYVLDIIDWNELIIDVDLGLGVKRTTYFNLKVDELYLYDYVTIYENRAKFISYLNYLLIENGDLIYLTTYPVINKKYKYDVDIVYQKYGRLFILSDEIKKDFIIDK